MGITNTTRKLYLLWISAALIIILTLLFVNESFAASFTEFDNLSDQENRLVERMVKKYLKDGNDILRFEGDADIPADDRIVGDVLVVSGTLKIDGEVVGDVLAVMGDVDLGEEAYVQGDVIAVNGKVWTHDNAKIEGDVVISNVPIDGGDDSHITIEKRDREDKYEKRRHDRDWPDAEDESFWGAYNRVDGLTVGMQFPKPGWWANHNHNFALIGKGGYSFGRKAWQYQLGMERWTGGDFRFGLGAEFHDMTDSQDDWLICDMENNIAAAVIREDFKDYYAREGYSLYATQNFGKATKFKIGYHSDEFSNLRKVTNWSVFGGDKRFRSNPNAISAGIYDSRLDKASLPIDSWQAMLTVDSRNSQSAPTRGWYIQAFAEQTAKSSDNALEFERYIVDVRRYQPLSWDENITFRLRAGTSTGILPPMYLFDLGGISTLRALKFKEMTGDRMVLGNIEYRLTAPDVDFLGFDIILFMDSGLAWFANTDNLKYASMWPVDEEDQINANDVEPEATFGDLSWGDLKTNVGVALASSDNDFRINFARRIDYGGADIVVTFRICKSF